MRRGTNRLLAVGVTLVAALAGPAAAEAATLEGTIGNSTSGFSPTFLTYTAAAGEVNRLTIRHEPGRYVVEDPGAVIAIKDGSGNSCSPVSGSGGHAVSCNAGDGGVYVFVTVADAGDSASVATPTEDLGPERGSVVHVSGGDGDDRLSARGHAIELNGGAGADTLDAALDWLLDSGLQYGGERQIDGGPGDDTIAVTPLGERRTPPIAGGDGNDTITGSSKDDKIYAGPGDDRVDGGDGYDEVEGGDGGDVIDGGPDRDALVGQAGDDRLQGSAGADGLSGGEGTDSLDGGEGDGDGLHGGPGPDIISGGPGFYDRVTYAALSPTGGPNTPPPTDQPVPPVTVTLDGLPGDGPVGENDWVLPDVESIFGTPGDDRLVGSAFPNGIYGEGGNDVLIGGGGRRDGLFAGPGDDLIVSQDGGFLEPPLAPEPPFSNAPDDLIFCGGGNDTVFADRDDGASFTGRDRDFCGNWHTADKLVPVAPLPTGELPVPITCPELLAEVCTGIVVVKLAARRPVSPLPVTAVPPKVAQPDAATRLGSRTFAVRPGKTRQVRVRLSAEARRAIGRKKVVGVWVFVKRRR